MEGGKAQKKNNARGIELQNISEAAHVLLLLMQHSGHAGRRVALKGTGGALNWEAGSSFKGQQTSQSLSKLTVDRGVSMSIQR